MYVHMHSVYTFILKNSEILGSFIIVATDQHAIAQHSLNRMYVGYNR